MFALVVFIASTVSADDFNTALMRATFKIAGPDSLGTAFLVGRPVGDGTQAAIVMVTAAHVLKEIKSQDAVLFLRKKLADGYEKVPFAVHIRNGEQPLWVEHPKADVAVMYIRIPTGVDIQLLSTSYLASDEDLVKYEVHPGDVLTCLGYPYGGEANIAGFPILRSGQIASYPITPTSRFPTFLYDVRILRGNSGGPVFLFSVGRPYGGSVHFDAAVAKIVGLVSAEQVFDEETKSLDETRHTRHELGLAIVVAAPLIQQTIQLLPPPPLP